MLWEALIKTIFVRKSGSSCTIKTYNIGELQDKFSNKIREPTLCISEKKNRDKFLSREKHASKFGNLKKSY